ncbi:MAG: MFS transporter [Rhodospirillales bacterium]|nr:MFS transporter [Alphaproteobacteria bacterium]MBL6947052.1 MFS transporter [Rhodospirillales bacterium]
MSISRVFIPFALGYFLSYLVRVVNAVIAPDLVRDLGLTAADLGLLTSANFLAFAAAQLPLGILLDRFGPRKTESALLLFAAAGCLLFATAHSIPGLITGRALIGFGTSACLMAAFKAYVLWVPGERIPMVNGLQMAIGGLGAVTGTVPVEMVLTVTDWRGLFTMFAGFALFAAVVLYFTVPRREGGDGVPDTIKNQIAGIGQVFRSPQFWRIAPMTIASQSMFLGTQSLWSGPWLGDVAGLPRNTVAENLLWIAISMVAGFLGMGTIADRLGRLGVQTIRVAFTGMAVFAIVQIPMTLQWTGAVLPMWMLFGFFGTAGILSYAALPRYFPPEMAGRVITGLNVFTFGGAFAAQWGMGLIINLWPAPEGMGGTIIGGGYAPEGYQAAFAVMTVLQVLALTWFVMFRRGRL